MLKEFRRFFAAVDPQHWPVSHYRPDQRIFCGRKVPRVDECQWELALGNGCKSARFDLPTQSADAKAWTNPSSQQVWKTFGWKLVDLALQMGGFEVIAENNV